MDVAALGYPLGVTPFEETPSRLKFPPLLARLPTASCGSGDSFATAATLIPCGVIDMEAYALAKVCWLEKTVFVSAKYVTDGANHEAAESWQQSVHGAAEEFLQLYRELCRLDRGAALV
jgi:adenosylhomocysteine nucleosidase